ncbi:MAG: maleylpyruvate isomerase family mycothiol-dependent enzyme [Blastococcus sp.]|nr:maleylpyruvate isomerase family mycothiol-dependent enzyme [Blastococcus sp.]
MGPHPIRTTDLDAVWAAIDHERLDLAALLDDLAPAEWDQPSLCTGWRVRDVAAHLALAQTGAARAALDLLRAGGRLQRMIHDTAVRHAALSPAQLTEGIRSMAGSRRTAPGVTPLEPLLDVLVHGQDIAVPLGRARTMPVAAATTAATRVWDMPWPMSSTFSPRRRLAGLRLVATDADWAVGEGDPVEGTMQALLMVLTGRTAAVRDRLTGPGVSRLR